MKKNFLFFGALSFVVLGTITSCKNSEGPAMPAEEVIKDSAKATTVTNLNLLMSNIPSPSDLSKELAKEGVQLNKGILNSPDKAGNYTGTYQQAVNMGIYGADMGYVTSYNQMQDASSYIMQVAKLAGALGVTSAYDQTLMTKFKNAVSNKDSLSVVIQTAFDRAQTELYSNKRAATSTLIFAGGWIEGLYIATNLVTDEKNDKNAGMYTKIWSHVYAFSYLQKALADYQASNTDCANMIKTLQPLFDIASKYSDASALSLQDIQSIKQAVTDVRNKLI
ncbi:MAG: hypothetical protein ACLQQ4_04305 [Bacteroidia bacterium]